MLELINKISDAIEKNDVTSLTEDFLLLSAEITNIEDELKNANTENTNLKAELEKNNTELNSNRKLLADLVRQVGSSSLTKAVIEDETINFDEILEEV